MAARIPIKSLEHTWLRRIVSVVDLDWEEEPICEHHDNCDKPADFVGGGQINRQQHGWLLCEEHARWFSQKTQTRLPRRAIEGK